VKIYVELEHDLVTDALVSIEAEDCVRDILGHPSAATLRELEQAESVLEQHRTRTQASLQKRERILQLLQEALDRESRAVKQGKKELDECEKNLKQLKDLIAPKKNSSIPQKRKYSG
jgi:multidrug resistance efflux pump